LRAKIEIKKERTEFFEVKNTGQKIKNARSTMWGG
jgi:hypothetical protein